MSGDVFRGPFVFFLFTENIQGEQIAATRRSPERLRRDLQFSTRTELDVDAIAGNFGLNRIIGLFGSESRGASASVEKSKASENGCNLE